MKTKTFIIKVLKLITIILLLSTLLVLARTISNFFNKKSLHKPHGLPFLLHLTFTSSKDQSPTVAAVYNFFKFFFLLITILLF